MAADNDYLNVSYSVQRTPFTDYPSKLALHLFKKFNFKTKMTVLEVGAGRCEVLKGFKDLGLNCIAADISLVCKEYADNSGIDFALLKNDNKLPFENDSIDIIYTKSLIEHILEPTALIMEFVRVLKPGGKLLCLTPDWESNMKIFYDDVTHVKPFTRLSLEQLFEMGGLKNISTEILRQLPSVWSSKSIEVISKIVRPFVHRSAKTKFLRWSRELMLIGYGEK
jgi:ubiquinone/menaquinone biosynthesis C-methylase UbiE